MTSDKWIAVSERLPDSSASFPIISYSPENGVEPDYWYGHGFENNTYFTATHWQHLPPPPLQEKGE